MKLSIENIVHLCKLWTRSESNQTGGRCSPGFQQLMFAHLGGNCSISAIWGAPFFFVFVFFLQEGLW